MTTERGSRPGPAMDRHSRVPSRRSVLTAAGAALLALAACAEDIEEKAAVTFPPPPRTEPLEHGVFLPHGPQHSSADAYAAMVGSPPRWMLLFRDWSHETPPLAALDSVLARGATPVLTWEPWYAPSAGPTATPAADPTAAPAVEQPPFALARLLAGDHDHRIRTWAESLAEWGGDVVLRFAHEMNGTWYPWGADVQGNTPEQYVRAWHHVHSAFAAAGAGNVRWCWAPNVPADTGGSGRAQLAGFFPGAEVVDLLGLDGYNWGASVAPFSWVEPAELFDPGLRELRGLETGLPIVVTETASAEGAEPGQSKAQWITDLFRYLQEQGEVRAVVWFQEDKERDWRVNSTAATVDAYRRAVGQLS